MGPSVARGVTITGLCRSLPLRTGDVRRRVSALSGPSHSAARRQFFFARTVGLNASNLHISTCVELISFQPRKTQPVAFTSYFKSTCFPGVQDDVIKWKHFRRYWPLVTGFHRSLVNSPHKGRWRWALIFSLICPWTIGWENNRYSGDLIRRCAHYVDIVM